MDEDYADIGVEGLVLVIPAELIVLTLVTASSMSMSAISTLSALLSQAEATSHPRIPWAPPR